MGQRSPTSESSPEQRRRAFGAALDNLMAAHGTTQQDLGAKIGISSQSSISAWKDGKTEPDRELVFRIERVMGVRPGHLSRHLGYLPLSATKIVDQTTEEAIVNDPALDDMGRKVLLSSYRTLIEGNRPKRGRPRTVRSSN